MIRISPSIFYALSLSILISSGFADTITLKTGEKLEGKITKETDKDVTVEYKAGAGITDERTVPKTEIEKVEKVSPESLAYQALSAIQLGSDSLADAQYESAISSLEAFVRQYPNSVHAIDAQTTLNAFNDEKRKTDGGQVKIGGKWLSRAEVEKERVQIGGRRAFEYMKSQGASGDYVGAMNTFTAIEKNYPGAAIMPDAIDLAEKVMVQLKPSLQRALLNQKAFVDSRTKSMASIGAAERAQITATLKQEQANADEAVDAAVKNGGWPPLLPNNEKSLTALLAQVSKEGTRLFALPVDKMKQSLQLTETARQLQASGDFSGAAEKLREASTLWNTNELAKRMAADLTVAQKVAAATPVPASTPAPTTAPATPKPQPSTPVASADEQPAATTAKAARTGGDEDRPFIMTLPGIICSIGGLAALLAGVNIYLKKKKQAENS